MSALLISAAPTTKSLDSRQAGGYWVESIQRQGTVPFANAGNYPIFRNVKDYGAKGDGSSDDTQAINSAITDGNRCGQGCDSSTTTPALVYFPAGTYVVSAPIVQLYFTQFVGDATNPPTLKAAAGFQGIAVIDSDPYDSSGNNWYTNQNNFYRQIRNFVIDLTAMPQSAGAGIHWQVAQATSLQNIVFNMIQGGGDANKQQGIFMDNGSGGFMSDLTFNGGNYGAFFGNQQFTTRNMTFNNCNTAIFMNWNWLWALKSVNINNCGIGVDMSNSPSNQTVGSVILQDSSITGTPVGVKTAFNKAGNVPTTGNTLIIDNVDFSGCQTAVQDNNGGTVLAGGSVTKYWQQGRAYTGASGSVVQGAANGPSKPANLLSGNKVFERSKPQYENVPAANFVSVKGAGAKGDGTTDDTQAIQNALNALTADQVLYFDHGAYIVSQTIKVPANAKMTGEIWPMIMANGPAFQDMNNPVPVFQVGQAGQTGAVEMSDLVFQTVGPQVGAILMEWNLGGAQGANGMWDVHFRIGGSAGTKLQSDTCTKQPTVTADAKPACEAAFMLLHVTESGSVYVENQWAWVADHELDLADHNQINVFNGRGVLIQSKQPTWWYGHASEHHTLYNYHIDGASSVYMSIIQTETAYFQSNPVSTNPFPINAAFNDPNFGGDTAAKKTWGTYIGGNSQDVLIYGAGQYSFFENWGQTCLTSGDCQTNMVNVDGGSNINYIGLSVIGTVNMLTTGSGTDFTPQALLQDNKNNYASTIASWVAG
ncbi:MAG: hypothetical protein Q9162_005104 [Coniocarpon cinnabarinum]